MDISSKCAMAARAIKFISTHDDAPVEVLEAALDGLSAFIAKEKEALATRTKAAAQAITVAFENLK